MLVKDTLRHVNDEASGALTWSEVVKSVSYSKVKDLWRTLKMSYEWRRRIRKQFFMQNLSIVSLS